MPYMNKTLAAAILDPDRSDDALKKLANIVGDGGEEDEIKIIRDACRTAVRALRKDEEDGMIKEAKSSLLSYNFDEVYNRMGSEFAFALTVLLDNI